MLECLNRRFRLRTILTIYFTVVETLFAKYFLNRGNSFAVESICVISNFYLHY